MNIQKHKVYSSANTSGRRTINASQSITANARRRRPTASVYASSNIKLTPVQRAFANQLIKNQRLANQTITAATNTSNIMAKPEFMDLLPLFVQKLIILDVVGSVAMNSRSQIIPYFKVKAENTKGETKAGDVLSTPFANRQGIDSNFTGRVIKDEVIGEGAELANELATAYTPVIPGTVSFAFKEGATNTTSSFVDNGAGEITKAGSTTAVGYIDYSTGVVSFTADTIKAESGNSLKATYQYDNENVGARTPGNGGYGYEYGAQMGKLELQLDEVNLVAKAHEVACYWSIFSAFAAQTEYGANLGDMAKDSAFSQLTAEINETGFQALKNAAAQAPQFDFDATAVFNNAVVPESYLNLFKLKLNQAAASVYQRTRLSRPNRLIVGSNVAAMLPMINGFVADPVEDSVGPYKLGTLAPFDIYVDPNYNPNIWVMSCKNNDIRYNSALFGQYMPLTATDPIGLANSSVQSGAASMYDFKVVNPATVVSGKIIGV